MNNELQDIKEDWVEVELIEVCDILDNLRKPINSKERNKRIEGKSINDLFPYYGATGQVGYIDDYLTDGEYVLIGEDAAPFYDYTKDVAYKISGKTWVNNHAHILKSKFNDNFLMHYLNCFNYHGYVSGTTRLKLTQGRLKQIPVKLAPLPIQCAIVSKIETLFSDLDNGIASLKKAQEQLKIYRQAVLKKAFEGELTKEWREKQSKLPTAKELLIQIKQERQNHYNQQIEDWKKAVKEWEKNGKEGKKPTKPKALKELPPLTEAELKELPKIYDSFNWIKLGELTLKLSDGPFGSNLKSNDYVDAGIRVIRLENIKNLFFDNSKKSFVTNEKYNSISNHTVYAGDIVFSTFIAEETKVTIIPNVIDFAVNKADCVCIRPYKRVENKYLEFFLATRFTYSQLVNQIHGATRPRINTTQLKSVPIPICSKEEQTQIVREIESRLSVADNLEFVIRNSIKKSEALRQSILKKAFEGKLLSAQEIAQCKQEPDYEPASVLLEKIKAEKLSKEQEEKNIKSKKKNKK